MSEQHEHTAWSDIKAGREAERCAWLDCARKATKTIWLGDDAGGREIAICRECFDKHFEA